MGCQHVKCFMDCQQFHHPRSISRYAPILMDGGSATARVSESTIWQRANDLLILKSVSSVNREVKITADR
jgi:hypothetical protein